MFAKTLEQTLAGLLRGGDVSPVDPADMARRFETLRAYGRLPAGREHRATRLSFAQIAHAVLGLAPVNPGWAGHAATVLAGLMPVGGVETAYGKAPTLRELVELLISDAEALAPVVNLSLSLAEHGVNSHGTALLTWEGGEGRRTQAYVSPMAVSLLQPGQEHRHDALATWSPTRRDLGLSRRFFEELRRSVEISGRQSEPPGDGSEYDTEEARQARFQALGVRRNARYLNVGVETQASWPKRDTVVEFDGHRLILFPTAATTSTSMHIDLHHERLDDREARSLMNRFLSMLAWEDDAFAILRDGWSGNPVPVEVPIRRLATTGTSMWLRPLEPPASETKRRALSYYREARNAEESELIAFAVLSYFKVIELNFGDDSRPVKRWIKREYPGIRHSFANDPRWQAFDAAAGTTPEIYIWEACRTAVAHASIKKPSNSDDMVELSRLNSAAFVLRQLARRMIVQLGSVELEGEPADDQDVGSLRS